MAEFKTATATGMIPIHQKTRNTSFDKANMAKAFISYSHRDEKVLDRLHTHLAPLRRAGQITAWFDRKVLGGDNIDDQISKNLKDSEIFLALVSPDFLDSNYCYEREMKEAFRRYEEGTLRLVPIILEPCDWKATPLGKLKALPKDSKPISIWTNENTAYLDIIMELRRFLTENDRNKIFEATFEHKCATNTEGSQGRQYRIRREFDTIDRNDFREKSFTTVRNYFRRSIEELNEIGDPIRARFEEIGALAFTCTVLNKAGRTKEACITVHGDGSSPFGNDISYSFSRHARNNTANGFIRIEANEYELFLKLDNFSFAGGRNDKPCSSEEAAESLWHEFISHAGIDHD